MAKAIVVRSYGGSEVLQVEDVRIASPGYGMVRIRQTVIGVNFHDVYVRSGLYKTLDLPGVPGCEAVGVVEELGEGVESLKVGDRVAYVTSTYGAYASDRLLPARIALKVPDSVTDEAVASKLLRAMTVEMLVSKVAKVSSGSSVLVHATAGGVGRMLCQALSAKGVQVIGTVGTPQKAEVARNNGCSHTILYRDTDFVEAVDEITGQRGVDIVFDSVGADTFYGSLDCLKPCGHLVNFGQSSGPVKPLEMPQLAGKSLTVSRPILFHYIADPSDYGAIGSQAMAEFKSGALRAPEPAAISLSDAKQAHDRLESMHGGGSLVLIA